MIVVYPTPAVTLANSALETSGNLALTTQAVQQLAGNATDDDGIPYVNPNVPGADIATGDKQQQIINLLSLPLTCAVTGAVSVLGAVAISALPLPPNAAQESAGQVQRLADLVEALLVETRTTNAILSSLGQPTPADADSIRGDFALSVN